MKISLYMARIYALSVTSCVAVLVILVLSATLMESAGNLSGNADGLWLALELSALGSVEYAYQVFPVASLLGALVTGTILARRGELMALQASGMSVARQAFPFLVIAGLFSAGGLWLGEVALPTAQAEIDSLRLTKLRQKSALNRYFTKEVQWFRQGNWMMFLPVSGRTGESFREPVLYRMENGLIAEVLHGKVLKYENDSWTLLGVKRFLPGQESSENKDRQDIRLKVSPSDLLNVAGNPRHMQSKDIEHLIRRRSISGADTTAHALEWHGRKAYPMGIFWMCVLALPWALKPNRKRSMALNIGAGVVAIGLLLAATHFFRMLCLGQTIPAWLGAWGMGLLSIPCTPLSFWLAKD
jgi:lipopolysaccharide export system permease protein